MKRRIPGLLMAALTRATCGAYLRYMVMRECPILVGPWYSEVGFEVLYWQPLLAWMQDHYHIPASRLYPLTRGGARVWYGPECGVVPDVYDRVDLQTVRIAQYERQLRTGMLKQDTWIPLDHKLVDGVATDMGWRHYAVLHPSWLYQGWAPYWQGHVGLSHPSIGHHLAFAPLPTPPLPGGLILPDRYLTVRFYHRATLRFDDRTVLQLRAILATIQETYPVILLASGIHADDHLDLTMPASPRLIRLEHCCTATNNLAVQSAVLARSLGFIGTYGGLAQLALRYGKASVSLYDQWMGTAIQHKHLADAVATKLGIPWIVTKLGDLGLIQTLLVSTRSLPDALKMPEVGLTPASPPT